MTVVDLIRTKRIVVQALAEEGIALPAFGGTVWRGAFGTVLRRACCATKKSTCAGCNLHDRCAYSYMFDTPPPSSAQMMRKYPSVPHPFVLEPPERSRFAPGETITFSIVLIGSAIELLPQVAYTAVHMGETGLGRTRGKYRVLSMQGGSGEVLYKDGKVISAWVDDSDRLRARLDAFRQRTRIEIKFLTPTRLKYEGILRASAAFHVVFRNLLRRISAMSYFHCGSSLDLDFRSLVDGSIQVNTKTEQLAWFDLERWSSRQSTVMKLGGFVGHAVYEGDLSRFMPYLVLGEQVHVGKGATFGLGQYRII